MAEIEVLKQKSEALHEGSVTAKLQILELLSNAQVDTAGKIAEALGKNNKIIYIPTNGKDNSFLANWLPKLDGILQSGMLPKIIDQLKGEDVIKLTTKKSK